MGDLAGMRRAYNTKISVLIENELPTKDPIELFTLWMEEIKTKPSVGEPNAMCLATANKNGIPSARYVLCKGYNKEGFKFFTHYTSRKGMDLEENPNAALTFYWPAMSRTVRIEGCVDKLPMVEAEEYFSSRPYDSQIGSLCSDQSKPVAGRHVLAEKEAELKKMYCEGQVPKPEFWGGYIVRPKSIEFWQGQTDRIHDRIHFFKPAAGAVNNESLVHVAEDGWFYERLSP